MVEHTYSSSEVVINQGDAGDHFYLVYSGSFEAYAAVEGGKGAPNRNAPAAPVAAEEEVKLNDLGLPVLQEFSQGEGFGELALLYNSPRAASVRAISADAVAYSIDRMAFRMLVMSHNSGVKLGLEKVGPPAAPRAALTPRRASRSFPRRPFPRRARCACRSEAPAARGRRLVRSTWRRCRCCRGWARRTCPGWRTR